MTNTIELDHHTQQKLREDFVILQQSSQNDCPLVYLDNAATSQKPKAVIDAITKYYQLNNANVHRGAHYLSDKATMEFEQARDTVKRFINARSTKEIIWTKGTTESINLVASSWGRKFLRKGDVIVLTEMEHHANIVPWQLIAQQTGAQLQVIKLKDDFNLDIEHFNHLLKLKPKIVAITHVSNSLGVINPIEQLIVMARQAGAMTLIDGAQAAGHINIDVQALDCDFYAFSGHKLYGPTGIGVLYGKQALLEAMPPWQGGGEMIDRVSFEHTSFNDLPYKFEAGTPNISGAIGLKAAIDYLNQYDKAQLNHHKQALFTMVYQYLYAQAKIELYSPVANNVGIISFNLKSEHHQDIGTLLDQQGVAVRTGHHCTMPLMTKLGISGTIRLSFSIYNNIEDAQRFISALTKVLDMLD